MDWTQEFLYPKQALLTELHQQPRELLIYMQISQKMVNEIQEKSLLIFCISYSSKLI